METGAGPKEARALLTGMAERLGVEPEMIADVYEDPAQWLLKEASLPDNVDPANSKLKDPEERGRLARVFERGLTEPVGYVLPIQRWNAAASGRRWQSERWRTRRGRLFLAPGDSPMGYRLPLSALPYVAPARYPYIVPLDPSVERAPLPDPVFRAQPALVPAQPIAAFTAASERQERIEQVRGEIDGVVRTALTIEPRDGRLCVFLPPLETLEDYLELVAVVEEAASRHGAAGPYRGLSAATRSAPQRHPRVP